jgi:hypothetical protein
MVLRISADEAEAALDAIKADGLDIDVWAEKAWGKRIEWLPGMEALVECDEESKVILDDFGISYEVEP